MWILAPISLEVLALMVLKPLRSYYFGEMALQWAMNRNVVSLLHFGLATAKGLFSRTGKGFAEEDNLTEVQNNEPFSS